MQTYRLSKLYELHPSIRNKHITVDIDLKTALNVNLLSCNLEEMNPFNCKSV